MTRSSHLTSFSSVQSIEESEMNLRPVLQRLPVEKGDQLGNGEVPKLPSGAQRRWSAVWGEACGESVFMEKLSMEGRHLASGPGRENSVACREAE